MDKWFPPTFHWAYDHLSMLWLKLIMFVKGSKQTQEMYAWLTRIRHPPSVPLIPPVAVTRTCRSWGRRWIHHPICSPPTLTTGGTSTYNLANIIAAGMACIMSEASIFSHSGILVVQSFSRSKAKEWTYSSKKLIPCEEKPKITIAIWND